MHALRMIFKRYRIYMLYVFRRSVTDIDDDQELSELRVRRGPRPRPPALWPLPVRRAPPPACATVAGAKDVIQPASTPPGKKTDAQQ